MQLLRMLMVIAAASWFIVIIGRKVVVRLSCVVEGAGVARSCCIGFADFIDFIAISYKTVIGYKSSCFIADSRCLHWWEWRSLADSKSVGKDYSIRTVSQNVDAIVVARSCNQ